MLLLNLYTIAQDLESFQDENDKYGFKNDIDQIVIPAKYGNVSEFEEGFAQVQLNNKWGWIDKTGQEVIPIKYNYVEHFWCGTVTVYLQLNMPKSQKIQCPKFNIDKTGRRVSDIETREQLPQKANYYK